MIEQEIWKPIKGYEGLYEVSNKGSIKSRKGIKKTSPWNCYKVVCLCKEGKVKTFYVHRLVAQEFIPNPENKPDVNHKDCNKLNNVVENLEWCSRQENEQHAWNHGLKEKIRETSKQNAVIARRFVNNKIPVTQLSLDGEVIRLWDSASDASKETGVDNSAISKCCKGKANKTGGYKWQYTQ